MATFDFEEIAIDVCDFTCLGVLEPVCGQLICAVIAVFSLKDAVFQHLFGGEVRLEAFVKVLAGLRGELVRIPGLHFIVYGDDASQALAPCLADSGALHLEKFVAALFGEA